MKKCKYYISAIILIVIVLYIVNINSKPFDPVMEKRSELVENYKLIDVQKTDIGTMVYSVGKVNNGEDNMYFADMVVKSVMGYKWVGGGGHINRDIPHNEIFVFSTQLLNEEQDVRPTILGIILDDNIRSIKVYASEKETYDAIIYDGNAEEERVYYIPLGNVVSNSIYFSYTVSYENGDSIDYIISTDEIDKFQEGRSIYFY